MSTYLMPGTNYTWECSETRYHNGRLVFLGYDDAEFCANAWERQTYGGLGAGLTRRATQRSLAFGQPEAVLGTSVDGVRRWQWSVELRHRGE